MTWRRIVLGMALIMQLAGITGNRPEALLNLKFEHVAIALLPDPEGRVAASHDRVEVRRY